MERRRFDNILTNGVFSKNESLNIDFENILFEYQDMDVEID